MQASQIYDKSIVIKGNIIKSVSRFQKSYGQVPEAIFKNRYFPSEHRCRQNNGKRCILLFLYI